MKINARALRRGGWWLGHGSVGTCLLFLIVTARAAEPVTTTSVSQQFVVRGRPQTSVFANTPAAGVVYVDPAVLAVTCERVKQVLAQELGWGDRWRGVIFVNVHPLKSDNEDTQINPFATTLGWRYRVEVPDEIDRTRLLETIIETLLQEFADRAATENSVALPPWLAEGLTAHLLEGPLSGLALSPGAFNVRLDSKTDSAAALRQRILDAGVFTVEQLSHPPDATLAEPASTDAYHQSAHLFVRELLRLRGGPDALCATLALLPEHETWQTAFLSGFAPHFRNLLDAEQWWALTAVQLQARESSVRWSVTEARQKIEDILYTPMQVQLAGDAQPHVTPVALQTVLNDWDFAQQEPLLQAKLMQLRLVRLRLPPEMAAVTDGYGAVLAKYLEARSHPGRWFLKFNARRDAAAAVRELDNWDAQRAKLSTPGAPATAANPVPFRADASRKPARTGENSKSQTPNSKQIPSSKLQTPTGAR